MANLKHPALNRFIYIQSIKTLTDAIGIHCALVLPSPINLTENGNDSINLFWTLARILLPTML